MNAPGPIPDQNHFIQGVMSRRCVAWVLDAIVIAVLVSILWLGMFLFGILTLGLGFALFYLLPLVPFAYHLASLMSARSATPGQRMLGLTVRRDDDLGPPVLLQALVSTLVYYVTLATSGLLLIVALFTTRHRTLHDLASGLVVVRVRAMEALTAPPRSWNMRDGTQAP